MLGTFRLNVPSAGSAAADEISLYTGVLTLLAVQPPLVLTGVTLMLLAPPLAVSVVTLKADVPAAANEVTGANVPAPWYVKLPIVIGVATLTMPLLPLATTLLIELATTAVLIVPVPSNRPPPVTVTVGVIAVLLFCTRTDPAPLTV